mgnify:CR=1 FL=1
MRDQATHVRVRISYPTRLWILAWTLVCRSARVVRWKCPPRLRARRRHSEGGRTRHAHAMSSTGVPRPIRATRPGSLSQAMPCAGSWVYFPSFFQTDANTSGADEAAAATLLQVAWRLHKAYAAVNAADAAVHAAATKLQRAARRHLQGRNSCKPRTWPSNLSLLGPSLSPSPRLSRPSPVFQPATGRGRSPRSCSSACRPRG